MAVPSDRIGYGVGHLPKPVPVVGSAMLKQSPSRKATFDEGVDTIQPQTILLPNWRVMGPGANDKLHPEGNKVDDSCASTTRYRI